MSEQASRAALEPALEAVPGADVVETLGAVARALPLAAAVESAAVRVRDTDGERHFHLLALEGSGPRETRRRALAPLPIALVKSVLALGAQHSLGRAFGFRWLGGEWILHGSTALGVLLVGSRTDRRPGPAELELLARLAGRLGERLAGIDRSAATLLRGSRQLARSVTATPDEFPSPALATLRPRERNVLELYAEGLSAEEIGRLLFISPHTVRTHVKNAFRRLGVHSREEAARLTHTDEVLRLV